MLSKSTMPIKEQALQAIDAFPEIRLAILFGSAASGELTSDSDIDIALAGLSPLTAYQKIKIIGKLSLVLHRPIDLVDLNASPMPILSSILSSGQLLLNRDPELYAKFIRRLWNWNADMATNHQTLLKRRRSKAFSA